MKNLKQGVNKMNNELIIKGVNIPFEININNVNNYINECLASIDSAKITKQKQDEKGNKLTYNNYTSLIKFLKNREEESENIVNKIKNKELEEIEKSLTGFKANIRVWRLELEKEQKKYKEDFLFNAKMLIKKQIKSIIDDVCVNLPSLFKSSNYIEFVEFRATELIKSFSGIKSDSLQNHLQSILNDMALELKIKDSIDNLYNIINENDLLNIGIKITNFDYHNIANFDILDYVRQKKEEAQAIILKEQEAQQRSQLLKKQQEEQRSEVLIKKEDEPKIVNSIPNIHKQDIIVKDYLFENQYDIAKFNKILGEICRFKTIDIGGKVRKVITGFID